MEASERLIVALDVNNRESALKLVAALRPRVTRFKVGLELFTACGPSLVREILGSGARVFLDLKFHDIPNTVARACVEAARLGAGMITVHLSGGALMARRAVDEVETYCQVHRIQRPQIFGVTVLTSLAREDLAQVGIERDPEEQVVALAGLAKSAGLDGVVASPREVRAVRRVCGPDLLIATPGIRLPDSEPDDQERTLSPREAMAAGADLLVVGRPILKASDPLEAAETILLQMAGA